MNNKIDFVTIYTNLILLIIAFVPFYGILYYINPIILLTLIGLKFRRSLNIPKINIFLSISILFSFIFNILNNPEAIHFQSASRALMIFLCLFFFPLSKSVKIFNLTIYLALIYIFLSQSCYMLGVKSIIYYFDNLYPYDGNIIAYTTSYLETHPYIYLEGGRIGGLFHNPNHCARAYTLFLALLFIENKEPLKNKFLLIVLLFSMWGILMAGSRTGFIILLIMLYLKFILKSNYKNKSLFLYLLLFIFFFYLIMLLLEESNYRSSDLSGAINVSFSEKIRVLSEYLTQLTEPEVLLFGNFDIALCINYITGLSTLDSEWGFAIFTFGVVFTLLLICFYVFWIRKLKSQYYIIAIPFLWALSSTILFTYRESLLFLLLLSIYVSRSILLISFARSNKTT